MKQITIRQPNHKLIFQWIPVTLFAIAMGFLESAVVVYLREIYYPEGFNFPLKIMEAPVTYTELFREVATLVMLVSVSWLCAKVWIVRFAWFIYLFAIWDIFYYVFLWALLGWPESLLTWDLLFLIPTTWVGPVLAPVINSCTMIVLAGIIIRVEKRNGRVDKWTSGRVGEWVSGQVGKGASGQVRLTVLEWGLLIAGALITILAYIQDYSAYLLGKFPFSELFQPFHRTEIIEYATHYIPRSFNWWLFILGELFFMTAIFRIWKITRRD